MINYYVGMLVVKIGCEDIFCVVDVDVDNGISICQFNPDKRKVDGGMIHNVSPSLIIPILYLGKHIKMNVHKGGEFIIIRFIGERIDHKNISDLFHRMNFNFSKKKIRVKLDDKLLKLVDEYNSLIIHDGRKEDYFR